MIDSVIAGTGNSRYLRTSISADTTWEDALTMLRNGTFPIDLAGINQAGFSTLGTVLNAGTLLKSAIITALDLDADATPSDAWEAVLALIGEKADADAVVTGLSYDGATKTLSATINGASVTVATFNFTTPQEAAEAAPVQSVAGKTGEVSLDAGDVAYSEETEYDDGTVGSELAALENAVSDINSALPNKAGILRDSVTGAIASFVPDYTVENLLGLSVAFSPVQDLHGYDSPWPAGGGKNKLPNPIAGTITESGVTLTAHSDGTFSVSGTSTASETKLILFDLADSYVIPVSVANGGQGCFYINNSFSGTGIAFQLYNGSTKVDEWGLTSTNRTSSSYAGMAGKTVSKVGISFPSGATVSGTFAPMFTEDGSTTATYSPYSNECPISGWSSLTVEQTGKNVWDEEWENGRFDLSTGALVADNNSYRSKNYIPAKGNTQYFAKSNTNVAVGCWNDSKQYIGSVPSSFKDASFTTLANTAYIKFYSAASSYAGGTSINYPATDHEYHAYNGSTILISLGQTVYSGTLDVLTGVVTVTHYYGYVDYLTSSWGLANGYVGGYRYIYDASHDNGFRWPKQTGQVTNCNMLKIQQVTPGYHREGIAFTNNYLAVRLSAERIGAVAGDTAAQCLAKMNAWLEENSVYVVYKMETPILIQLTPQEVSSLLGVNNMWSDANGNLTVDFAADLKTYIDNKIAAAVAALS